MPGGRFVFEQRKFFFRPIVSALVPFLSPSRRSNFLIAHPGTPHAREPNGIGRVPFSDIWFSLHPKAPLKRVVYQLKPHSRSPS